MGGVGGSAVGPAGAEASVGGFFNPGWGDSEAEVGAFASGGAGAGVNASADVFLGYVSGSAGNVSGVTSNRNDGLGPLSLSLFRDPDTGELAGGTIGLGAGLTPAAYSKTIAIPGTVTMRDLLDLLLGGVPCEEPVR